MTGQWENHSTAFIAFRFPLYKEEWNNYEADNADDEDEDNDGDAVGDCI